MKMRACDFYHIVYLAHILFPNPYPLSYQMFFIMLPCVFKHLCMLISMAHSFLLRSVGKRTRVSNASTTISFYIAVTHITLTKCSCSFLFLCIFIHFYNDENQGSFHHFFGLH